jgi:CRP-like cAMP-binding protein
MIEDPQIIRNIELFKSLSEEAISVILKSKENSIEEYPSKQIILREDEMGDCMYVILEGTVEVMIRGGSGNREITIATLRAGDFFGEQALLPEGTGRRNATVRALHPSKLFKIDKKYVLLGVKKDVTEPQSEDITEINPNLPGHEVRDLIMKMRLFQSLGREELISIDDWTRVLTVGPGEFVIKEDEEGDYLYVVLEGIVDVFNFDDEDKIVVLARLEPGTYFGEQALLAEEKGKRNAYVRTDGQARLIQIPKEYFRLLVNRDSELAAELKKAGEQQRATIRKLQGD